VRRLLVAVGLCVVAFDASAADLPEVLRGPIVSEAAPFYRWSGVYGGGQVGFSVAAVNFTDSVRALVADEVRLLTIEQDQHISQWPLVPKKNPIGGSFGGFVGYNWQWEDAVVGVELNYNRTSLSTTSGSSISRSFFNNDGIPPPHNFKYNVTVTGVASARITDFGTFRLRGAWAAGPFLPYAFMGFAVGRTDISRSGSVFALGKDQITPTIDPNTGLCTANCDPPLPDVQISENQSDSRSGVFAYGGAAGLGVDVALLPNLFWRAEWEYIQFAPVEHMHLSVNTVRTGLGLKF
jgi:outer membrane immunogenic protein